MMITKPPFVGAVGRRLGALGRRLLVSTTVLTPAALLLAAPAQADDYVWVGGSGADYAAPANWNLNTAFPGNLAADTATFGNTAAASETVTLAGPATLAGWTFNTTAATAYTVDGGQTVTLSGGILNTSTGGTHTIANAIAGAGGIVQNGAGSTLVLSGANSYTGATTVSAGTLEVSANDVLGSSTALSIAAGATFDIGTTQQTVASLSGAGTLHSGSSSARLTFGADNSSTAFSGNVTNAWIGFEKYGNGTFTFSGTTWPGGGTFTIHEGTVALTGGADTTNTFFNMQNNTTLDIAGTVNGASVGFLSGATGTAVHLGNRTLTIEHDSLRISTYMNGVIDGSGGLTLGQNSFLRLTNDNLYTGATTLTGTNAELELRSAQAIAASSELNIAASGATVNVGFAGTDVSIRSLRGIAGGVLRVGDENLVITHAAGDFAGVIERNFGKTGGLVLAGGHQTLSGINTYTGATTVNGGTLSVNGSIATSALTTVNAGGTLGGNGTVGNTAISGGALAPGNSIGTLAVNGNLSFTAASSYMIEVSPANADRTNVTGSATLGGATVNASFAPGSFVARQYTILNAAGGLGGSTFGAVVNNNLPSSVTSSLSYDANNVYLDLALNFAIPGGLHGNQANAGHALTNFFDATGGIPLAFAALTPAGLSQVSGETAVGSQQTALDAMNLFMGVMTDPFLGGRGDIPAAPGAAQFTEAGMGRGPGRDAYAMSTKAGAAPAAFAPRWSVWAAGYGGSQTTDGNATPGTGTASSRIYGTAVGADYRFSPDTLAGFALAGGGTSFSVNGFGGGRSDLFQAGAFLRHTVGPAYLSAALAYGWQDITTDRTVTVAGVDRLRAQFNASAFSGRAEAGYRFATALVGLTPYAAGKFTAFELPAYAESVVSGANTFALAYGSKAVTASRSELGLRTDKSFAMPGAVLTLRGRAAWAHDFDTDRSVAATFQTLPGASFVVNGAAQPRDKALTTAAAEVKWMSGFSLAANFEGEFSPGARSYAGKGIARYNW
ncbi:autotransporter domain-containing protein [Bradyrhizobium sp.]|uniref:autotransporter outer membrane beta-barrel domain-containing protein n=1 Tax=Bradyrhizobium sp. TaxID=376 RepID=UPI0027357A2B|nr:autotransporter domain-containing protein [Bradyrhizobium sp.]MDP3691049.1 autotransporter domain-containing protein [Bradyrhizobium sp.]